MDDDLVAFSADQNHEFEQVPGSVRPKNQPPVGILTKVIDHQGVFDGMEHVLLVHAVTVRRVVGPRTD